CYLAVRYRVKVWTAAGARTRFRGIEFPKRAGARRGGMSEVRGITVTDKNGLRGEVRPEALPLSEEARYLPVTLAQGGEVMVPVEALVERQDGSFFLPLSLTDLGPPRGAPPRRAPPQP